MITQPFTFKAQTLYGAYAHESGLCVYGACPATWLPPAFLVSWLVVIVVLVWLTRLP